MIISVTGDKIPEGEFIGNSLTMGDSREECLEALQQTHAFAQDVGESVREDGVTIYTMIGGVIV
jgi:hypothetical protein